MSGLPIRFRVTAALAVAMALVLAASGWFLYDRLDSHLAHGLDSALQVRAEDLATLVRQPNASLSEDTGGRLIERGESFAQLLDPGGSVLDATKPLGAASLLGPTELGKAEQEPIYANRSSIPGLNADAEMLRTLTLAAVLTLLFTGCATLHGYTVRESRSAETRRVGEILDPLLAALDMPSLRTIATSPGCKIGFAVVRTGKVNVWSSPATSAPCLYFSLFVTEGALAAMFAIALGERLTLGVAIALAVVAVVRANLRALVDIEETAGEIALVYLGGSYSHAVRKRVSLRDAEPDAPELYLDESVVAADPSAADLRVAEAALAAAPFSPDDLLYARVDLVHDPDPLVLELELAEPSLYLLHADTAATRLAGLIADAVAACG